METPHLGTIHRGQENRTNIQVRRLTPPTTARGALPNHKEMVSQVVDTPLDASVVDAYGLHAPGPAKRGQARLRNPRDISQVLSAAKKKRRAHDTSEAKRLGPDPAGRQRAEGQRTGLRNLGATCYMNSLLQTLT